MKKRRNMKRNWKDDMEEEKIKKGQALLTMKIKAEKHLHLRDPDLMKIPLEALHKVALQQIGEQEAYIEELEDRIRDLEKKLEKKEERFALSRAENRRIAEEVRREEVNARIWKKYEESQQRNGALQKKCRETANENIKYIMENERLKARIAELEQALTEK